MPDPDVRANTPATVVPGESPASGAFARLDPDWLTVGEETFTRRLIAGNQSTGASGDLRLTYFTARKTETITQVRTYAGSTAAAATPTLCRIGVWTADLAGALLALVGSVASDVALWAVAGTEYTSTLTVPWAKVAGQRYAWGPLIVTAAARPTMPGFNMAGDVGGFRAEAARSPRLSGLLTGQADLPATATAASLGGTGVVFYASFVP